MLENFPSYLESQRENFSIFDELRKRQFKKNQVYSSEIIQYTLLLRHMSLQSCKLLLDEFPLSSISLLNKIKEGNIDALKAAKLLLENRSISKDIVVLFDEMYLQKCVEYCGGELLKDEPLNCLKLLIAGGFNVKAVICYNHAANVSAFTKLILQFDEDNESLFIKACVRYFLSNFCFSNK